MPRGKGRTPSKKTPENITEILTRLSLGESLRSICKDEHLPSITVFMEYLAADKELADQYARARERQADYLAEEIIEIADDSSRDVVATEDEDGNVTERVNHEHINRSRLRVDARKWYASKLAPKKYGDRQEIEHTGKDGTPLIPVMNIGRKPN